MSAVELENFRESKRKNDAASKQKRVAAMSAVELENYKVSKQNNDATHCQRGVPQRGLIQSQSLMQFEAYYIMQIASITF